MENKLDWIKFRESGLLWFVNRSLHLFGWSIIFIMDEAGDLVTVYPSRVRYRGFVEKIDDRGFAQVTKYLKDNIVDIEKDLDE